MPELTPHENAALQVFLDCYEVDAWEYIGGDLSPRRKDKLQLDVAESFALGYGIAWTADFAKKVFLCSKWFLQYDARVLAAELEGEKFLRDQAGPVN